MIGIRKNFPEKPLMRKPQEVSLSPRWTDMKEVMYAEYVNKTTTVYINVDVSNRPTDMGFFGLMPIPILGSKKILISDISADIL